MSKPGYQISFHDSPLRDITKGIIYVPMDVEFTHHGRIFFHPYVGALIGKINEESLPALFDPKWQKALFDDQFFKKYNPPVDPDLHAKVEVAPLEIDVRTGGAYANYNWELFFHIPLTVATHLSKTQRFAEAQKWFHYIFDPTSNDQSVDPPKRFWKFLPFRTDDDPTQIDEMLRLLSLPVADLSGPDADLRQQIVNGYQAILDRPFQPHAVARTRHLAYQYSVVMKYLDNLIAWGDQLFQQDTIESIGEATQRYVLAANILGPRPQQIPSRGTVRPKTFAQLKQAGLDELGNALVELEGQFPFNLTQSGGSGSGDGSKPLLGIGRTLYFCVPRNEKLLAYWDTVADRLFKIRHCMNIQGVVRPLALFDPPLDPGMLVKAAAAGIDVGSIVNGLSQPATPVRATTLIQKALELCSEVRALGSSLLASIEKSDGEHLARMRQQHELRVQRMSQEVRFLQWKAAEKSTETLFAARGAALERLQYYARLLNLPVDRGLMFRLPADRRELTEENFDEAYEALVEQYGAAAATVPYPALQMAGGSSPSTQSGASGSGRLYLNRSENAELNEHLPSARDSRAASAALETLAAVLVYIPDLQINLQWWGLGASPVVLSGAKMAKASKHLADILRIAAAWEQDQAGMASRRASHERRADDWLLNYNLAAHDVMQNGRQILASLISEQVARHEYRSLEKQIENSEEADRFLREKFSNEELHLWMQGEISRLFYEYYRFAFDTARRAERAMKQELMRPELDARDFVKFNYWDGGRKGMLAGESLHLDVKRMELAYLDNNKRELELTRHVSLRQLDPLALLALRATGTCQFTVPEWLYDRDCPGHYMRRIRSVAVSIPSVVGPYTSVHCTLSLLKSSIRKSPVAGPQYARQGAEDDRFVDYAGGLQSIVTSSGNNDSGLFETSLRDDRLLPFEAAGSISTWQLSLPPDYRAFDYETISDVILHIRYTARQGVDPAKVKTALQEVFSQKGHAAQFFSLRHDFPMEWAAFLGGTGADPFTARIRKDYLPYLVQNRTITIDALSLYATAGNAVVPRQLLPPAVSPAPPSPLAGNINAGFTDLTVAPDSTVLKRDPEAPVYLILRYSF